MLKFLLLLILLLSTLPAHAQIAPLAAWNNTNWQRNCASLDMDFVNDKYYINHNTTCDGTTGSSYTGIANFISGAGATFTRAGTNTTSVSAPFYINSLIGQSFVSRASTATYFDNTGTMQTASTNVARSNYTYNGSSWVLAGTLIEPAATNSITNGQASGAVVGTVGSGGSLPTGWAYGAGYTGIAMDVTGAGTEYGMNYIEVRLYGTTSSNSYPVEISFRPLAIAVAQGQTWTHYCYVRYISGTTLPSGTIKVYSQIDELSAGGVNLANGNSLASAIDITTATVPTRVSPITRTLTSATVAYANPILDVAWPSPNGQAVDFKFRVYTPQMEQSSSPTSYIPTSGATASRSADVYNTDAATYFDSSGVMRIAPQNTPRMDYDPVTHAPRGVLIEWSHANRASSPGDFTNAAWTKTNVSTATGVSVFDGTTNGATITDTGTNGAHSLSQNYTPPASRDMSFSVFAKAGTLSWIQLNINHDSGTNTYAYFNLSNGTVGSTSGDSPIVFIQNYGNGWYRCQVGFTNTVSASDTFTISLASANGTNSYAGGSGTVILWGGMIDQNTGKDSVGTYIGTTNVGTNNDAFSFPTTAGGGSGWYNTGQGTLAATIQLFFQPPANASLDFYGMATIGDLVPGGGTLNTRIGVGIRTGSGTNMCTSGRIATSGVTVYSFTASSGSACPVLTSPLKAAMAFSASHVALAANNTAIDSSSPSGALPTVAYMDVGYSFNGNYAEGWVQRITYFPVVLSDTAVQQLTQ